MPDLIYQPYDLKKTNPSEGLSKSNLKLFPV